MLTAGEGKHRVWLKKQEGLSGDLVYILGGGNRPHIGSIVLKVPGEETRVLNIGTHKDFHVLVPIAEKACEKYGVTVVVVGGVHIDEATREDIDLVMANCRSLHDFL